MQTTQQIIEDAGFSTRSYSGRGMYGEECLGAIIPSGQSVMDFVAEVIQTIKEQANDLDEDKIQAGMESALDDFCSLLRASKIDTMGEDGIIYFPGQDYFD